MLALLFQIVIWHIHITDTALSEIPVASKAMVMEKIKLYSDIIT